MRPISTLHDGQCWWDLNLHTSANGYFLSIVLWERNSAVEGTHDTMTVRFKEDLRIYLLARRNLLWDILRLPSSRRAALGLYVILIWRGRGANQPPYALPHRSSHHYALRHGRRQESYCLCDISTTFIWIAVHVLNQKGTKDKQHWSCEILWTILQTLRKPLYPNAAYQANCTTVF